METILERSRNAHEAIEQLEQAISDRLLATPRTVRDSLQLDHEMAEMLETIEVRAHALRALYADEDGAREREIAKLSAADGLDTFYAQLAAVKEYHRRYPDNVVEDLAAQYAVNLPDPTEPVDVDDRITKMFSGEETYGRHLDLIALHSEFINLKRNRTITYAKYLEIFDAFGQHAFPQYVKDDPQYVQYLRRLLAYLESFHRRILPLEDHAAILAEWQAEFDKEYKTINGASENQPDGIWCGICQKMYSKQTVYDGHLNSKKHKAGLKAAENGSSNGHTSIPSIPPTTTTSTTNGKKEMARLEAMITRYGEKFSAIKSATRANVARKSTLTDREWQAEQYQQPLLLPTKPNKSDANGTGDDNDDSDEDEEGGKIDNPLNLPLSWDGKPIPFWLYKLHGLGNEFPCEVCGNYIYKGRKSFDKHFSEPRHLHGLTCLGIQAAGTALYDGVVNINDALALREKQKLEDRKAEKKRDENVEMEDESGNVMSERVYRDLQAQGIL